MQQPSAFFHLPICGSCHLFLPVNEYVQVPIRKADIEIMEKDRRRGVDADEGNGTTIHAPLLFSVLYDSWNLSSCGFFCLQKLSSYILKKKKSILHLTTIIDIINIYYNQANQRNWYLWSNSFPLVMSKKNMLNPARDIPLPCY